MKTAKGIFCLNCKIEHQPGSGYKFDNDFSLICCNCDKTIYPTSDSVEIKMNKYIQNDRKSRTTTPTVALLRPHFGGIGDCD